MDTFIKTICVAMVATITYVVLQKTSKEISVVFSITVCSIVAVVAFSFLGPVIDFISTLIDVGNLNLPMVTTLIKAVGICMISEFVISICADAGNTSLGKGIQILTSATLLFLSTPYLSQLLDIVQNLLSDM